MAARDRSCQSAISYDPPSASVWVAVTVSAVCANDCFGQFYRCVSLFHATLLETSDIATILTE